MTIYIVLGFLVILLIAFYMYTSMKDEKNIDYEGIKKDIINQKYPSTPDPIKDYIILRQLYNLSGSIEDKDIDLIFEEEDK